MAVNSKMSDRFSKSSTKGFTPLEKDNKELPVEKIHVSPLNEGIMPSDQEIDEMADSIKQSGLIDAISVIAEADGTYRILSGHKRYLACKKLGMTSIRVSVLPAYKSGLDELIAHTDANIERRESIDAAFWVSRFELLKKEMTVDGKEPSVGELLEQIKKLWGIGKTDYYRYMGIMSMIPELRRFEAEGIVSVRALSDANTLGESQQMELVNLLLEAVRKKEAHQSNDDENKDVRLSMVEFKKLLEEVRKPKEQTKRKKAEFSIGDKLRKSSMSFAKAVEALETDEERMAARGVLEETIEELKKLLEKL